MFNNTEVVVENQVFCSGRNGPQVVPSLFQPICFVAFLCLCGVHSFVGIFRRGNPAQSIPPSSLTSKYHMLDALRRNTCRLSHFMGSCVRWSVCLRRGDGQRDWPGEPHGCSRRSAVCLTSPPLSSIRPLSNGRLPNSRSPRVEGLGDHPPWLVFLRQRREAGFF